MKANNFKIMRVIHYIIVLILIPAMPVLVGYHIVPSMWHYLIPLFIIALPFEIYYYRKWKEWKRAHKEGYEIHY